MAINAEELRKRYASLSDEALLSIEREDLTPIAQTVFDSEVRRRRLHMGDVEESVTEDNSEADFLSHSPADEIENDGAWMENSFPVTIFSGTPAGISDAADARHALHAAGIPCEITEHEIDPAEESEEPQRLPYKEYRINVPSALSLQATSVLDIAIFNARLETDWKTQLESLSDEELQKLSMEALCAGLLDRAERLRRVYKAEIARRSGEQE